MLKLTGLLISSLILQATSIFRASGPALWEEDERFNAGDYGVDASYPIHHPFSPQSVRGKYYQELMEGCYKMYSKSECDATERGRIDMNLKQARSQHNYTELGFKHRKLPQEIWLPILEFYSKYKDRAKAESWGGRGNTYVNHWEAPTKMVSFEDKDFVEGIQLKNFIWDKVQPIIEEWVGHRIHPTSLYGIRIYSNNSVLATHVDRLPLVSSCIIQVDQEVDEPWPIEVYSHAGKAYNVTMQPGDMVLYESSTVLHGRPFKMKGKSFANIFVHYEPDDHTLMNKRDREPNKHLTKDALSKLEADFSKEGLIGGHEALNQFDYRESEDEGQTSAHAAAREGDVDALVTLLRRNERLLTTPDVNGWLPIHEAARGGNLGALKYLIQMGADVGSTTKYGGTPLWWARRMLPANHAVVQYLESIGAPEKADTGGFAGEF